MSIFVDVCFLIKRLQVVITLDWDIWNSIAIVVLLNTLCDDFKLIFTSMLDRKNKIIDKIQLILTFAEVKFIIKHIIGMTKNIAIISWKRNFGK